MLCFQCCYGVIVGNGIGCLLFRFQAGAFCVSLGFAAVVMNAAVILITLPNLSGVDGIFEAASAFGTVGMTAGVTMKFGIAAQIATILTMFIGRIGPISFALAH